MNIGDKFAKKSLGQNFIVDNNFLLKMKNFIDSSNDNIILEIGPGKGALTKYLSEKRFKNLYLIEKDNNLAAELNIKYGGNKKIKIFHDDALVHKYNYLKNEKNKVIIYGNLPFNISTKLLTLWLNVNVWPSFFDKMILMFQKEVADRILAKPNNKLYGRLSVLVQSRCEVKKLLDAPSSIFRPKPKVDGAVLQFKPIEKYRDVDFSLLGKVLEKSFNSRRKKVKNTLKDYQEQLQKLKIDENSRPENLSVKDYCDLVKLIN
ncbi:MAG: ribosomal RNA small subunit methyltransferase A [Candidatus Marinimicrobia bacterium]|nr:ribosomal RNA small subunit methyltransferase A [Candidatus Neomarinimicrobiota bacterium]